MRVGAAACLVGSLIAVVAGAPWAVGAPAAEPATTEVAGPAPGSAPWPSMRHDLRNTGSSSLPGVDPGTQPWSFRTGRGIFSTPVVDADGVIYVGSADHNLYGIDITGKEVWRFPTGEIIDTAPALVGDGSLIVGSGDEYMYRVRTDPAIAAPDRVIWRFKPSLPTVDGQLVNWWEGSPNLGPDGAVYQGNTGGGAYAVNPDGTQRWAYQAGNSVWTVPALDDSGTTYWGSLDQRLFALSARGTQQWQRTTLGYVTSSPALDRSGTLYAGSFDGTFYALDSHSGKVRWKVQTGDHIYGSPALLEDDEGLNAVIIGSTDGLLYSFDPAGKLLWTFDTGAPIRSSPVIGQAPTPGDPAIVYVGTANGRLVAVSTADGSPRWMFDTTSQEPTLAARNQLNGSPALGVAGIYIGSQDGTVWFVPYDYCLRAPAARRCVSSDLPAEGQYLVGVDVGGRLVAPDKTVSISPAGYLTGRVLVRSGGRTLMARLVPEGMQVTVNPPVPTEVSLSGDGRYLFVVPQQLLKPDTDYQVTVTGLVTTGGPRLGNLTLGPGDLQPFTGSFTAHAGGDGVAWQPEVGLGATSGLTMSRLAVPMPPMLTSLNQIGFDFYDWIGGTVRTGPDATVVWLVGARRDHDGQIVADPSARFAFPVVGQLRGGTFKFMASRVNLWFTFGPVPLRTFDLRGTLGARGQVEPTSQFLAQAVCQDVPSYGAQMPATGMCDPAGLITAAGTFLGGTTTSPALRRVPGLQVGSVTYRNGVVQAPITAPQGYTSDKHLVSILLLDSAGMPVPLDYYSSTTMLTDGSQITGVQVRAPDLPPKVTAVVMTDAFPALFQDLQ